MMFVANHQWILIVAMFMPLALLCYIMCNPTVAREFPKNYVLLGVFTLCIGFTTGITCAAYETRSVAIAAGITAVTVIGLVAFAMQTTYDFSGMGPYMFVFFLVFFGVSIVMMFLPYSRPVEIIYAAIGALLFSMYIVYDTQLIAGGKHQACRFSVDDYVFAALNLYLDIINLFIMLLRLFGDRR